MIPFIDLHAQQKLIRKRIDKRIKQVLDHGQYILGPEVKELEDRLSSFTGSKYVLCCSSGTDALLLSLLGLKIKPGEGVIVPAFTFASSAEVMPLLGAIPIFVDVKHDTFNIDPTKLPDTLDTAKELGVDVKGIMPVGLFGQPAEMDLINDFAKNNNLWVLDDAAQSFGGIHKDKIVGNLSEVAATSFFPAKPLGCYGDGGALFTNDDTLAEKARMIVNHGMKVRYYHDEIGVNSRLDSIQAAVLSVKLQKLNKYNRSRNNAANYYDQVFSEIEELQTPVRVENSTHVFHQYTLRVLNGHHIKVGQI